MDEGGTAPVARRASDADREAAARVLRDATADGRLDYEELTERLGRVYAARTTAELEAVAGDIAPVPMRRRRRRVSPFSNQGFRAHFVSYVAVNGALVLTWAATGIESYFWPIWPIAGWGVGLVMHGEAVCSRRSRSRRPDFASGLRDDRANEVLDPQRRRQPEPPRRQTGAPPGTPPRTQPVSRWVAVMFTDVADSTRLNEALGDDQWAAVRARHRELVRETFASHGGTEVSSQGDGSLARFPSPAPAVACAVDLQRKLDAAREAVGFAPRLRIGVHAGDAVEEDGDLIGAVVNVAARVTKEAEPDEILVTEPVAEAVAGRFDIEDRGLRDLKGVSKPRHLLAVRWRDSF